MNKLILSSLLFSCLIGNVYAVCNYDLEGFIPNPTDSNFQKFLIVQGQKLSYKILSSNDQITYGATHSNYGIKEGDTKTGTLSLPTEGVVALEYNIKGTIRNRS